MKNSIRSIYDSIAAYTSSLSRLGQEKISKPPCTGYALSEYRTKLWLQEALIEGWFPLSYVNGESFSFKDTCEETAYRCLLKGNARRGLNTDSCSCLGTVSQRLASGYRADEHQAYAVGSKTRKIRWMGKFVLDPMFDRRTGI